VSETAVHVWEFCYKSDKYSGLTGTTLAEPLPSTQVTLYRQQDLWLFNYAVFPSEHLAS
jgi:hypothetical protein